MSSLQNTGGKGKTEWCQTVWIRVQDDPNEGLSQSYSLLAHYQFMVYVYTTESAHCTRWLTS